MKRALSMAVFATLGCAPPALAQVQGPQHDPLFLAGVEYARITELTGTAGVLIPLGDQKQFSDGDTVRGRRGVELTAGAGTGGVQLAAGFAGFASDRQAPMFFGLDLRGTVGWQPSRGSSPRSTYVGVDASQTFMHIRYSVGAAYRVNGDSSHSRWMFAPSIGIVFPLGRGW